MSEDFDYDNVIEVRAYLNAVDSKSIQRSVNLMRRSRRYRSYVVLSRYLCLKIFEIWTNECVGVCADAVAVCGVFGLSAITLRR